MKRATLDRSTDPAPATAFAGTMTAIVQDEYGSAPEEVLRIADLARPTISDDEILVRVRGASLDRGTWHIMAGLPYPIRVAGFGLRTPKHVNPGRSAAGPARSIGKTVTEFKPGDDVYGTCDGSFAQYARTRAGRLATKPANLSFEQAAAVPVSALTALQALRASTPGSLPPRVPSAVVPALPGRHWNGHDSLANRSLGSENHHLNHHIW